MTGRKPAKNELLVLFAETKLNPVELQAFLNSKNVFVYNAEMIHHYYLKFCEAKKKIGEVLPNA